MLRAGFSIASNSTKIRKFPAANVDGMGTCGAASCPATLSSMFHALSSRTGDAEVRHDRVVAEGLAQMHHQLRTERYAPSPVPPGLRAPSALSRARYCRSGPLLSLIRRTPSRNTK